MKYQLSPEQALQVAALALIATIIISKTILFSLKHYDKKTRYAGYTKKTHAQKL